MNFQGPGDDEPFRVNKRSITQLDDYKALFDGSDDAEATGEASYSSMYVSGATERIHRRLPHAKLIAILRDPVERAHSNFMMMVEQGREPLGDFAEALSREEERIRNDSGDRPGTTSNLVVIFSSSDRSTIASTPITLKSASTRISWRTAPRSCANCSRFSAWRRSSSPTCRRRTTRRGDPRSAC